MFNYNNIKVNTNENGEKVITMPKEIFTELIVKVMQSEDYEKEHKYNATAECTKQLWMALCDKDGEQ